ncbi:unnamed protein product [Rhizoctonia solani]|uniref:Uncharacterized protein n=1 Tax=Rhizoctonia solani TaxID=456999 RepID=A0A8H3AKG2_9AGAM|nr:unnamed protein product [Rhizoctonia solani]
MTVSSSYITLLLVFVSPEPLQFIPKQDDEYYSSWRQRCKPWHAIELESIKHNVLRSVLVITQRHSTLRVDSDRNCSALGYWLSGCRRVFRRYNGIDYEPGLSSRHYPNYSRQPAYRGEKLGQGLCQTGNARSALNIWRYQRKLFKVDVDVTRAQSPFGIQ